VDRTEVNVFVQLRAVNRGWSKGGKLFREMEAYCEAYPGTFCFNGPTYEDQTARPAFIEFGLVKRDGSPPQLKSSINMRRFVPCYYFFYDYYN